jgi:hypothetical protein
VDVEVTAEGFATIECTGPGGAVVPGPTREVRVSGVRTGLVPEGGRVEFCVFTAPPVAPPDAAPDPRWTPSVGRVVFTSATLTVTRAGTGSVLLRETFIL